MTDMSNSPIGKPMQRREDARFLTGAGQYTDDVTLPHQTYAVFVRSPHAHAVIKSVDISRAMAMPGVERIFTGKVIEVGGVPVLPVYATTLKLFREIPLTVTAEPPSSSGPDGNPTSTSALPAGSPIWLFSPMMIVLSGGV